jgi:predicted enzyme related to lactoylglutathione lyase
VNGSGPLATIGWVQIDCRDPDALRAFWGELLGLERDPDPAPDAFRPLARPNNGTGLSFQRVPERKLVKNRVHLDLIVEDIDAVTEWIEAHGGSRRGAHPDFAEGTWRWRTMADPEGNEFCLVPTQAT